MRIFAPQDLEREHDAKFVLDDGSVWTGFSFGARKSVAGEVVFNTGMLSPSINLCDPDYAKCNLRHGWLS